MKEKRIFYKETISSTLERLKQPFYWFPYPAMISFFLTLIFIGHLLLGINPRLGNPAQIMEFSGTPAEEGALWLSLSLDQKGYLIVTTAERKVIHWNNFQDKEAEGIFKKHLKESLDKLILSASLEKKISHIQTIVVFAIDQSLTFYHLRPLLYILAQVGISEYAFETRAPAKKESEKE